MAHKIGVVIVTYNSADVVGACIESLRQSPDADRLRVVVVDNQSRDGTIDLVRCLGDGAGDWLTLLPLAANEGYAFAVNRGIEHHRGAPDIAAYWVLNPDCVAPAETPGRLLDFVARQEFGLASGRCRYLDNPDIIQTDGGRVSRLSGVCASVHAGREAADTPLPDPTTLDYLTGAHLLASRRFVDEVGLMPEDYFLYYEEVDWAFRRGDRPLHLIEGAEVLHHGGTSIGSGSLKRAPSAFSNYFNHRNRLRFVGRYFPSRLPSAYGWSLLKAAQVLLKVGMKEAAALLAGVSGLGPTAAVRRQNPSAFDRRR